MNSMKEPGDRLQAGSLSAALSPLTPTNSLSPVPNRTLPGSCPADAERIDTTERSVQVSAWEKPAGSSNSTNNAPKTGLMPTSCSVSRRHRVSRLTRALRISTSSAAPQQGGYW